MPISDADIDDQLRAAMKTLDGEAPSGYFEALPDLTLARLEGTMQQGTQGTTDNSASAAPPPVAQMTAEAKGPTGTTEDSGLHDIRNLAQSTKQRLSSRRIGTVPPVSEDDLIASSSAGWKAVALPQPAKMVALPELAELPSKKEVLAKEKAAAKAEKAAEKAAAKAAPVEAAPAMAAPAAAVPVLAREPSFSLPSAQPNRSRKGLIAVLGLGIAAAAGATIFVSTQKHGAATAEQAPAVAQVAPRAAAPVVTPIEGAGAGSAATSADVQKAEDDLAKAQAEADKMKAELATAQAAAPVETKEVPAKAAPKATKGHGKEKVETTPTPKADETKAVDKGSKDTKKADGAKTGSGDAEPDFNELLKEAGVKEPQKKKPVLAKKELTGDDFKSGMAGVTAKAHGCYKGTQGTAMVKLTIAPSGQIAKIAVTGAFSTTPEGACVVSAIKAASFPPWDGHPQSFTYPILLSE